jgi:hypothetical protein
VAAEWVIWGPHWASLVFMASKAFMAFEVCLLRLFYRLRSFEGFVENFWVVQRSNHGIGKKKHEIKRVRLEAGVP